MKKIGQKVKKTDRPKSRLTKRLNLMFGQKNKVEYNVWRKTKRPKRAKIVGLHTCSYHCGSFDHNMCILFSIYDPTNFRQIIPF